MAANVAYPNSDQFEENLVEIFDEYDKEADGEDKILVSEENGAELSRSC